MICGETNTGAFGYGNDFFAREFWRFVLVQQTVGKLAQTAIEYPPMQDPASFQPGGSEEESRRDDQEPPRSVR